MIRTHGLSHIALAVRDPDVSLRFYQQAFGLEEYFREGTSVHARRPEGNDIVTFVQDSSTAGQKGGVLHFGFRLRSPEDVNAAISEVEKAGGTILRKGEFAPGVPYFYASDPDGYELEVWFE